MKSLFFWLLFISLILCFAVDLSNGVKSKSKSSKSKTKSKSKLKLPKKYKDLGDRSLYCSVCNQLLIEAQLLLLDNKDAKFEYANYGYRVDSKGNRIKRSNVGSGTDEDGNTIIYATHTILPIIESISKNCDKWSKQTGTESRSDGTVRMIKTDRITGSFSGSLNLGGDSSNKISSMCHDIMNKFDDKMIDILKENNLKNLMSFCDNNIDPFNTLDKVCEPAEFTHDIIKNIKHVNEFKAKQRSNREETEIEMEDDNDGGSSGSGSGSGSDSGNRNNEDGEEEIELEDEKKEL